MPGRAETLPARPLHAPFLLRGLRPRIERERGAGVATKILVENSARAFAADWRAD